MISFPCPACGRMLTVKEEFAGKSGTCPHCKQRMKIPAAATAAEVPTLGTAVDAPPPPAVYGERLDFLAPPQGKGELGRLGSYRVLKVLGSGGMGMVLLAEDPALKRSVALKVMRPELAARPDARQRFLREAQATAAIEHPHIVHVYQVGEDRGVPFLAMPFLKGEALDARLKREKRLPVADVVRLGRQIAEGLAAAHRNGLIHRDIKPANIWLERQEGDAAPRGWVKILDFGLARAVADDDGHLTKTGAILGTPAYMAPEQARSEKVDARCDLFSLGAVLYRMLTGEAPFKGSDPISLIAALALDTPRPVQELNPAIPAPLADLVMQLLTKDPAGRPPTARAVADALAAIEEDRTQILQVAPRPPVKPAVKRPRRWLLPAAGGAGVLLVLIVLALIFFPRATPPHTSGASVVNEPPSALDKEITNAIGMKLVRIEPGRFIMGSPPDEKGRQDDEIPHEVAITKPFYLGAYPVTVGQFKAFVKETKYQTDAEKTGEGAYVIGPNGAFTRDPKVTWRTPPFVQTDDEPVLCVSWADDMAFCAWLSKKEGKPYSLPSEAQWEYACRAGARTKFFFGDDDRELAQYAWYGANSGNRTHPVGQLKPNAWGLYDMEGNAFELTADWYDKDYYKISPAEDPPGPGASNAFMARGCGYYNPPGRCRAASRTTSIFANRNTESGFRVALLPEQMTTNSVAMKLAWIPAGKFTMGSPPDEKGRHDDEDAHEVVLTKPFYLGVYKVTVGQFKAFVDATKYQTETEKNGGAFLPAPRGTGARDPKITWRTPGFEQTDDQPVVCVTWADALAFCAWLSKKEGRPYSLPTEAQWEYACRAGSQTKFPFGDDEQEATRYAWLAVNSQGTTHPVGLKKPNAWGLFDMVGDAWEFTADWYNKDYYKISPTQDPPGPGGPGPVVQRGVEWAGGAFVARGVSKTGVPAACRAANRIPSAVQNCNPILGFRVALLPEQTMTNSLGMKLAWIPAGKFTMGSPPNEKGRRDDEGPRPETTISRPFYLGTYPVTVGAWRAFVMATGHKTEAEKHGNGAGYVGNKFKQDPTITWQNPGNPAGWKLADDQPVVCVSWDDAVAFCAWLSNKEGRSYRLPTEAEWEYACRAGTQSAYPFGEDASALGDYAWVPTNSEGRVHAVGEKKPNAWGLYDMQGDVFQWCSDWYGKDAYHSNERQDPQGPGSGTLRTMRGESWDFNSNASTGRAACRFKFAPDDSNVTIGFRIVLAP